MKLAPAMDFARRLVRSARGGFSPHDVRARVLSGADPLEAAEQLGQSGSPGTYERRMRLAGLILEHAGEHERARKIYSRLLERNPAQPIWLKYAAGVPAHDVILLEEYGLAYCPIPKNASSSIKARINFLMRGTNDVYSHRFFTNVYETSQTTAPPDLTHYFSFAVARDPVERLLSYYQKNIVEEGTLARELQNNRAREVIPPRPTVEEFIDRLESYIFYFDDVHHHTLPQSAYLKSVLSGLSHVYRISEVDTLFEVLSSRTGVRLEPTYLLKSSVRAEALLTGLGQAARDKLAAFYREDYELLRPWLNE